VANIKSQIRATRAAITVGDKELAVNALLVAAKKLDKAASKGVIHKNQAANRKSAIARAVAAL
jgi:small subunit ribosomal protein S20